MLKAVRLQIAPRVAERGGGAVDSSTFGVGVFAKGSDHQAARTGAEVENRERDRPIRIVRNELLDQCLGLGARDQHAGPDREIETPELFAADDESERLARSAAGDEGVKNTPSPPFG